MRKSIVIVTPEAVPLVTLADMKTFLRVDTSDEDDIITDFISTATEEAVNYMRRSIINRTLKLTMDAFPRSHRRDWWDGVRQASINVLNSEADSITLPFPNIQSITSFVTYDDANTSATFSASAYSVDTSGARVYLNEGEVWPVDLRDYAAIEITYVSGYGAAASDVPSSIKTAVKMHVQEMYEMRRYCAPPEHCTMLLDRYRIKDGLSING